MECSICGAMLLDGEPRAIGPDGESHAKCAKRGKAHGQEITLLTLHEDIGRLKARVQQLERTVDGHARNIDVRVGPGGNNYGEDR